MSIFKEPFYNLSDYPQYKIENCQQDQFYKKYNDVKKYSEVDWSMRITQANSSFLAAFLLVI